MMKRFLRLLFVAVICTLAFTGCEKMKRCRCTTYVYLPYGVGGYTIENTYTIKIPESQRCSQRNINFPDEYTVCTEVD